MALPRWCCRRHRRRQGNRPDLVSSCGSVSTSMRWTAWRDSCITKSLRRTDKSRARDSRNRVRGMRIRPSDVRCRTKIDSSVAPLERDLRTAQLMAGWVTSYQRRARCDMLGAYRRPMCRHQFVGTLLRTLSVRHCVSRTCRTSRRTCTATPRFSSRDSGWSVISERRSLASVGMPSQSCDVSHWRHSARSVMRGASASGSVVIHRNSA